MPSARPRVLRPERPSISVLQEKPRHAGFFFAALLILGLAASPAQAWTCQGVVSRVHDGDTLSVRCGSGKLVKVRLARIDAPELRQEAGPESLRALTELVEGREVVLRSRAVDRYQRTVADLEVEGEDLSEALVRAGWAWCGRRAAAGCRALEAQAREARRGLWQEPLPQAPWDWRRAHPRLP